MRGDVRNHHGNLELHRIAWATKWTIPNMAGNTPNLEVKNTNTRPTEHNQASQTPYFSSLLILPIISICQPHLSFLSSTLPSLQQAMLGIPPYLTIPWFWVHTKYSIYCVAHSSSTASTKECMSPLYSNKYKFTHESSFCLQRSSRQVDHHQPVIDECWPVQSSRPIPTVVHSLID